MNGKTAATLGSLTSAGGGAAFVLTTQDNLGGVPTVKEKVNVDNNEEVKKSDVEIKEEETKKKEQERRKRLEQEFEERVSKRKQTLKANIKSKQIWGAFR